MVGIGLLCALMIVVTFETTLPMIKKNQAEALERAIFRVLPGAESKEVFVYQDGSGFTLTENPEAEGTKVYAGYSSDGSLSGIAIEASGMGFADIIRILYGYDINKQQVVGFNVLESKETPGLGDKIEKDDDFLANFEGLDVSIDENTGSLVNTVVPVKYGKKENPWEVDGITGATISSRAIGDILGMSTGEWIPILYRQRDEFAQASPSFNKVNE
jgi:electron transport complex protein RnfG